MAKTIKVVEEKRPAPSKACVKCGVSIHARTVTCKECGATQPIKERKPKQEEPKPELRKIRTDIYDKIKCEHAILRVVVKHGGMEKMQALLSELIDAFGDVTLDKIYSQLVDWEIANK